MKQSSAPDMASALTAAMGSCTIWVCDCLTLYGGELIRFRCSLGDYRLLMGPGQEPVISCSCSGYNPSLILMQPYIIKLGGSKQKDIT